MTGEMLPQGEIGEIYSRIAGNPDFTYHNKPEKRAEIDRDGFITSGDVGYIDEDGYVFICDRKRDMVISGGVNIYPAEIEAALHAVPGVHDCAVFGIPDEEFGEALMAVVEPQAGRHARHRRASARSSRPRWPTTRCRSTSKSRPTCRARIPARSSSAACAIPIGSGRGGGFDPRQRRVPASRGQQRFERRCTRRAASIFILRCGKKLAHSRAAGQLLE